MGNWFSAPPQPEPQTTISCTKTVKVNTVDGKNIYQDRATISGTTNSLTAERVLSDFNRTNNETMRDGLRGVTDVQQRQRIAGDARQQILRDE